MQEKWCYIAGYEGLYKISSQGKVWSYHRNKLLNPSINEDGYLQTSLHKKGKIKTFLIHRLVASAFIPNPEDKPEVDHINTNKVDNRATNLRWATPHENHINPITIQNQSRAQTGKRMGKLHISSRPILCIDLNKRFWNAKEACRSLGINWRHIGEVARGERRKAGGFSWRYLSPPEVMQMRILDTE